ncbi:hypothetical protein ScPMuIL_010415 [Solemya velum]
MKGATPLILAVVIAQCYVIFPVRASFWSDLMINMVFYSTNTDLVDGKRDDVITISEVYKKFDTFDEAMDPPKDGVLTEEGIAAAIEEYQGYMSFYNFYIEVDLDCNGSINRTDIPEIMAHIKKVAGLTDSTLLELSIEECKAAYKNVNKQTPIAAEDRETECLEPSPPI